MKLKNKAIFLYFSDDMGVFCLEKDKTERELPKALFINNKIKTPNQQFEIIQDIRFKPLQKTDDSKLVRKNFTDFSKLRVNKTPLGKRLSKIREKIISKNKPLLSWKELERGK
jgi:hypothetical protein